MTSDLPITLERCDVGFDGNLDPGRSIVVVPQSHDGELTEKQLVDYKDQRIQFLSWLLSVGKNPRKADGYAPYTVYSDAYRTARFDRWVWEQAGRYKYPPDAEDAHDFMEHLAYSDKGRVEKGKLQEGINHLNKWLHNTRGEPRWDFEFHFPSSSGTLEPRDFLSKEERRAIRQAALNEGNIPSYESLTTAERQGWKQYVAVVLDKAFAEITKEDWEKVDGWEVTSLVWTSLDAGLRPDEVSKATTSWVDSDNGVLRIPYVDSTKNEGNWTVSLTDRTTTALERWLVERRQMSRYNDTDRLWLTSQGNPYGSQSLARLLKRLCDQAGIDYENRQMSWYTIRHSVGTYMVQQRDLKAAKDQLRHKSPKTTMQYDQVSVEERRDALENI